MRPFLRDLELHLTAKPEDIPSTLLKLYETADASKDAGVFRIYDAIQDELRAARLAGVDTAPLETLLSTAKAMLRSQVARSLQVKEKRTITSLSAARSET